jgi:hypothetical protein
VADGIRVEVMELKPVVIKKAAEERTRGEGQSPFGKMEKCDDFVNIFHGERFTVRGAPVDKVLLLQPSKYSKKDFKTKLQKKSKIASKVLDKPAVLSYEELGGLSDPGPRDWVHNVV